MLAALACVGMTLANTGSQTSIPAKLDGVHRIVFLGDSITAFGERPGGYVWLVRNYLTAIYPKANFTVLNSGISGHKSTDMLARFDRDVLKKRPDMVFISVGVNDVWHGFYDNHPAGDGPLGIKLDDYTRNVEAMIQTAESHQIKVNLMLATLIGEDFGTPENRKAEPYNKALAALAAKHKCGLVDLQAAFRGVIRGYRDTTGSTQNFLTTDGVHMNDAGNVVMAQSILTSLGVPDSERIKAEGAVNKHKSDAKPGPGSVPEGRIISDGKPATATSSISAEYGPEHANSLTAKADERWCANGDNFTPNPYWQVDLGTDQELSGLHVEFVPLDTWRYEVEVSTDGKAFRSAASFAESDAYVDVKNIAFSAGTHGRYLRIRFTRPTAESNWPSLRRVAVYGK